MSYWRSVAQIIWYNWSLFDTLQHLPLLSQNADTLFWHNLGSLCCHIITSWRVRSNKVPFVILPHPNKHTHTPPSSPPADPTNCWCTASTCLSVWNMCPSFSCITLNDSKVWHSLSNCFCEKQVQPWGDAPNVAQTMRRIIVFQDLLHLF